METGDLRRHSGFITVSVRKLIKGSAENAAARGSCEAYEAWKDVQ